jgi:hypothetical protein
MTMTLVIALNAILDLGIVLGLFAMMGVPFRVDRPRTTTTAQVHPLPEPAPLFDVDLAA